MTTRKVLEDVNTETTQMSLQNGVQLVQLARQAITTYIEKHQTIKPPPAISEDLLKKSGAFVTLNSIRPSRQLRGCIGFPYPEQPLVNAVIQAAIYAATEDPRFPPLSLREFADAVTVEITALTPPRTLKTADRKDLPNLVQVGRHGLVVEGMGTSGLLLPQVASEWKWDASEFLMNCCLKAGLPPDSWLLKEVEVKVFEGESFEETKPQGEIRRRLIGEA